MERLPLVTASTRAGAPRRTRTGRGAAGGNAPLLVAGLAATMLIALALRDGYFRDEFYYLACARRPAWGSVGNSSRDSEFARWSLGRRVWWKAGRLAVVLKGAMEVGGRGFEHTGALERGAWLVSRSKLCSVSEGASSEYGALPDKMVGPTDLQRRGLRSQQQRTQAQSRKQEVGPMGEIRFVGLDVHKESIAIAVAEQAGGPPQTVATVPHEMRSLLKQLKKLASVGPIRCCYEAGPTGFALQRALQKEGIDCVVIAPSLTPKQAGDRVKTDRRDAEKLARFYRSGDLTAVYVPDETTEAMRDLERAREDAKRAQGTARRQLQQFLLRHGRRYEGKTAWTGQHMEWIRYLKFEHEAHNRVLVDYVAAVENATARLVALTKDIVDLVETWSLRPLVKALQALRGVQLLTAVTLVAEIGNFARFASAPKLMAYLGLVPSEHSSGEMTHRGRITRCGNRSVRTALVERAWNNRFRPKVSRELKKRHDGVAPDVCAIAWKAQQRLHAKYARLTVRGKNGKKTITAMARELAGFVWAIAREPKLLTPSPTAHA